MALPSHHPQPPCPPVATSAPPPTLSLMAEGNPWPPPPLNSKVREKERAICIHLHYCKIHPLYISLPNSYKLHSRLLSPHLFTFDVIYPPHTLIVFPILGATHTQPLHHSFVTPTVQPEMRGRSGTDVDTRMRQQQQQQVTQQLQQATNLSRSRSAQSLKQLADQSSSDDKMTVSKCFLVCWFSHVSA